MLFVSLVISCLAMAQVPANGIINHYAAVTNIVNQCVSSITVNSTTGFSVGDKVLIIQMKGAAVNTTSTNPAVYGSISNINNAGNYEYGFIDQINGNTITLSNLLQRPYTVAGVVQLVRVHTAVNFTVNNVLRAQAWNGSTGGVVALEVSGTLTLNANINVSGQGFRGGSFNGEYTNVCNDIRMDASFLLNQQTNINAAAKGEGIAAQILNSSDRGLGAFANGGGGGGHVNSGGAGGGNAGIGGNGSNSIWPGSACVNNIIPIPSRGAYSLGNLVQNSGKLFLGGGGGSGHNNRDNTSSFGGNGGGIIILSSNTLVNNGFSIISNGFNGNGFNIGGFSDEYEGAGGGGAGGAIVLNFSNPPTNLIVRTIGGNGSTVPTYLNNNNVLVTNDGSPGGGGGGGFIISTSGLLGLNALVTGGASGGQDRNGAVTAQAGANGSIIQNYQLPQLGELFDVTITSTIQSNITCAGQCNGVLRFSTSNFSGQAPFRYEISTVGGPVIQQAPITPAMFQNFTTLNNACAGDYVFTIFDANNCSESSFITLNDGFDPAFNVSINDSDYCNGDEFCVNLSGLEGEGTVFINGVEWFTQALNGSESTCLPLNLNQLGGLQVGWNQLCVEFQTSNGLFCNDFQCVEFFVNDVQAVLSFSGESFCTEDSIFVTYGGTELGEYFIYLNGNLEETGFTNEPSLYPPNFIVANQNFEFETPGIYEIVYVAYANGDTSSCSDTATASLEIRNCCFAATDPQYTNLYNLFGSDGIIDASDDVNNDGYIVLNGKYYVPIDMEVQDVILDITNCDLVFDPCVGLTFIDNSQLRANNSVFRPCNTEENWRGILLQNTSLNFVNECTFKRATVAILTIVENEEDETQTKVENNLFQNCHVSAMFVNNTAQPYNFEHPVTGNSFFLDQSAISLENLDFCFPNNNGDLPTVSVGIGIARANMTGVISQNNFVNNNHTSTDGVIGVFLAEAESAIISENTFTNLQISTAVVGSQFGRIAIEDNEIEVSRTFDEGISQIFISNSNAQISITNNEIVSAASNTNLLSNFFGIEIASSSNVEVISNQIRGGFAAGIYSSESNNLLITSNDLKDFSRIGIELFNTSNSKVNCNTIDANDTENGTGIRIRNTTTAALRQNNCANLNVFSNCIFNSLNAIQLTSNQVVDGTSNDIRDNYLYNYWTAGINNTRFNNLRIGWNEANPGQNTFWSNRTVALDIRSVLALTTAFDNFGLSNYTTFNVPSGFGVIIQHSDQEYSTSSCGNQTLDVTSMQNNLDRIFTCEYPFENWISEFDLAKQIADLINIESETKTYELSLSILVKIQNEDPLLANAFFDAIAEQAVLDPYYYHLLAFKKAYLEKNYSLALNEINQVNLLLEDHIELFPLKLKVESALELKDIRNLNNIDLEILRQIVEVDDSRSNNAREILCMNYQESFLYINKLEQTDEEINENEASMNFIETANLSVYPNPAQNILNIEINTGANEQAQLVVYDVTGKLLHSQEISFVSGAAQLDVSNFSNGFYMLAIQTNNNLTAVAKFVKK